MTSDGIFPLRYDMNISSPTFSYTSVVTVSRGFSNHKKIGNIVGFGFNKNAGGTEVGELVVGTHIQYWGVDA